MRSSASRSCSAARAPATSYAPARRLPAPGRAALRRPAGRRRWRRRAGRMPLPRLALAHRRGLRRHPVAGRQPADGHWPHPRARLSGRREPGAGLRLDGLECPAGEPDQPPPVFPGVVGGGPKLVDRMVFDAHIDHAVVGLMDPTHGPYVHQNWWWRSAGLAARQGQGVRAARSRLRHGPARAVEQLLRLPHPRRRAARPRSSFACRGCAGSTSRSASARCWR